MDSNQLGQLLVSTETYRTFDTYHTLFSKLRREQPLALATPEGYRPFWVVTRYEDIKNIEIKPEIFTNAERSFLISAQEEQFLGAVQQAGETPMGRSIVQLDGSEHRALRQVTQTALTPGAVRKFEELARTVAREMVGVMIEKGGACDFVKDVALLYPLRVIMAIIGLPRADENLLLKLTLEMFGSNDPETGAAPGVEGMIAASQAIRGYFDEVTKDRRRTPRDDLASVIANARINGELISDMDAAGYYVTVITAGHDTTSSTTSVGMQALIENPGELAKLRSGEVSIDSAINEFLRWATPIKHFFRTAHEPYELRGVQIAAGDSLMLCFPSANRDEDVFPDPFAFRVDRSPNPQLAFGYGPHVCLGQHLGKMEMRVFFEELLAKLDGFHLAGDPVLMETNFIQGHKTMPITYQVR